MTQVALAAKAGLHPHYISSLEGAHKIPSLITLEQLAKGLGVELPMLLDFPESHGKKDDRVLEELELLNRQLDKLGPDVIRKIRNAIGCVFEK